MWRISRRGFSGVKEVTELGMLAISLYFGVGKNDAKAVRAFVCVCSVDLQEGRTEGGEKARTSFIISNSHILSDRPTVVTFPITRLPRSLTRR